MIASPTYRDRSYDTMIEARADARILEDDSLEGHPIDAPVVVELSYLPAEGADPRGLVSLHPLNASQEALPADVSLEGNRVTLTPKTLLDYSSQYCVSVSPALESAQGLRLTQEAELYLYTEGRDFSLVMTNRGVNTVRPGEELKLEYQLDTRAKQGREVTVALYSLPGFDAYRELLLDPDGADVSALSTMGELVKTKMKEGLNALSFQAPDTGYCVVRTSVVDTKTGEEVVDLKPVQVATQALYFQAAKGQMFLWLNDSKAGGPLAGYRVSFLKDGAEVASAVTDEGGTALVPYSVPRDEEDGGGEVFYGKGPAPLPGTVFTIYDPAGNPVYADSTIALQPLDPYDAAQDRYYSFFYIDRALYRPTDTIHFWGYVKPYALNRSAAPKTVVVTLDPDGLDQKMEVAVREDGTFTGELSYEQIVSSGYQVQAELVVSPYADPYSGEQQTTRWLDSHWIDVKEFTTPAFTISSTVDDFIYNYGDEVQVTITPTFFDGTPLPNYPVEFSLFNPYTGNFEATVNLTTDDQGVATTSFPAGETVENRSLSWTPKRGYYYVKIAHDGENITYQGTYNYLPSDIMFRPALEVTRDGAAKLTVTANRITTERLTGAEQVENLIGGYYSFEGTASDKYDVLAGEPADVKLNVELNYSYTEPVDHLWKNDKEYKTLEVVNGKGALAGLTEKLHFVKESYLRVSSDITYWVNGNKISASASGSNGRSHWEELEAQKQAVRGYTFNIYRNGEATPCQEYEEYFSRNLLTAGVGDSLRFELCHDGVPVKQPAGKLLYTVIQDELVDRGYGGNGFTLTQRQSYANSVVVVAAYFDGSEVWPVQNVLVEMDRDSLALSIEATTDKPSYQPGEEVTVRVKVKDQKGAPVLSRLCVSVVDEAVFALQEQYFNVLNSLYGDMSFYNYFIFKYATATGDINPYNNSGDGGKGDGAEMAAYDSFRKNFKDTAAFYPTTTDAEGNASVTFTLPDNITSWRITTVAVGENLYGGSSKENFVTTLPFFVKPVLSPKYIDGDEVAMLIQGHGTALKSGDRIAYRVRITGDGVDQTYTAEGEAYESVQLNFGKLAEGEYTVTSTGEFDGKRDTVELPLAVIHSNLELVVSREVDLRQPVEIAAMRYPVTMTLYYKDYEPYYKSIGALLTHYCFRIDQRMSRFAAKRALTKHCLPEEIPQHLMTSDGDVAGFQNPDGGIGWYVGGESDPEVTFKVLLFAGDMFSADRMARYFTAVTEDAAYSSVQQAAAWAGLAAVDPGYASTLRERLDAASPAPTYEESLYYLAGLSYSDPASARAYYAKLVTPKLKTHRDEAHIEYSTAPKFNERQEADDRATALAWISASRLKLEDADAYSMYFSQYRWRINSIFECMIYVTEYEKPLPAPEKITYFSGGQNHEVSLGIVGSKTLVLNRSQMSDLKFTHLPDTVAAMAYYIGEPEEAGIQPSETLNISKEFEEMEGGRYKVTLKIDFDSEAAYGYYNVSDWIPSSMRLYSVPRQPQSNSVWIQDTQENQKLYFEFRRNETTPSTLRIEYYVQRTFDTEAVVDRTYVICADSGENARTERDSI